MIDCPYRIWINNPQAHLVPCGTCGICRQKKYQEWSFRIWHEMRTQKLPGYFVTLTYNRKNVPWCVDGMSLRFKDVQDFLKRYRKSGRQCKYVCSGEYGPTTQRPHYHLCLWTDGTPKEITDHWQNGSIHVGALRVESALYAMKYILNPTPRKKWKEKRERPRAQYSKGLGLDYLNVKLYNYHTDDENDRKFRKFEGYANGSLQPLPRYYSNKIFSSYEKRWNRAQNAARSLRERQELATELNLTMKEVEKHIESLNASHEGDLIRKSKKQQTL